MNAILSALIFVSSIFSSNVVDIYTIKDHNMEPILQSGDRVEYNSSVKPHNGDLIVFECLTNKCTDYTVSGGYNVLMVDSINTDGCFWLSADNDKSVDSDQYGMICDSDISVQGTVTRVNNIPITEFLASIENKINQQKLIQKQARERAQKLNKHATQELLPRSQNEQIDNTDTGDERAEQMQRNIDSIMDDFELQQTKLDLEESANRSKNISSPDPIPTKITVPKPVIPQKKNDCSEGFSTCLSNGEMGIMHLSGSALSSAKRAIFNSCDRKCN